MPATAAHRPATWPRLGLLAGAVLLLHGGLASHWQRTSPAAVGQRDSRPLAVRLLPLPRPAAPAAAPPVSGPGAAPAAKPAAPALDAKPAAPAPAARPDAPATGAVAAVARRAPADAPHGPDAPFPMLECCLAQFADHFIRHALALDFEFAAHRFDNHRALQGANNRVGLLARQFVDQ